jgi:hypothetical protein
MDLDAVTEQPREAGFEGLAAFDGDGHD